MGHKTCCQALQALLLLMGLLSVASASRGSANLQAEEAGEDPQQQYAMVAVKYQVPPGMHAEFVQMWKLMEDGTFEERGMEVFNLKRSLTTNNCFYMYGEWQTMADFEAHMRSRSVGDFISYLSKYNVKYDIMLLQNLTKIRQEMRQAHEAMGYHVLMKFRVPPSRQDDFVSAWTRAADEVRLEEGNTVYALRKSATSNHCYFVYGSWTSHGAYERHLDTDYHSRLHSSFADLDVTYEADLLEMMAQMTQTRNTTQGGTGKGRAF